MHRGPEVVAHRGASAYQPEHTFAAYDLALEMGADALELDVRLRDGRLVVLHDRTVARTRREPLPLADVLDRYGARTGWLIELKEPDRAMEAALLDLLDGRGLDAVVQSFDHRSMRRLAPHVPVAPLIVELTPRAALPGLIRRLARYATGIGLCHTAVDVALAHGARASGLAVRAYTVNEPEEMARLLAAGVDGLITDRPDAARAAIAQLVPVTALAA